MNEIDLRAFGALEAKVEALNAKMASLESKIDTLTALLNQARGARWLLAIIIGVPSFFAGVFAAARALR